jgi:threonine dehydrogenase-like Zn-dependent dehydrogenase
MTKNRMILEGFDIIYDCVGNKKTVTDSLRCVKPKGTVVLVGIDFRFLKVDLNPIWYQEITLTGILGNGMEVWNGEKMSTFDVAAKLFLQKKLTSAGLITHKFSLDQWKEAVKTASKKKEHEAIKVGIEFD